MPVIPYMAKIQFDFGAVGTLAGELKQLGVERPLVVTDQGIVQSGIVDRVLSPLPQPPVVFDATPGNPTIDAVAAALSLFKEARCDGLVGLGGGSCIDAAKAVALLATHPEPLDRYEVGSGGSARITPSVAPVVAIPTTAGTGSEVGRGMGVTLADGRKGVFISQNLIPDVAICDPDLTRHLPRPLAAGTGADALSHCVEAFLSPAVNPPAEAIALDGVRRLWSFLPRAVADGNDRDARWNVMMGALEGGMAMWKGLGPAHALALALDELDSSLHHGTTVGVLMPYCLAGFATAVPEKHAHLREAMGLPFGADIAAAFRHLNASIGLPASIGALGVAAGCIDRAARSAAASFFNASSPKRGTVDDYAMLLAQALGTERRPGAAAPAQQAPSGPA